MKASALILILVSVSFAHEICKDYSAAVSDSNSFCSDYSGHTCCTSSADTEIRNFMSSLSISDTTCRNFIQKTQCAKCDPWGGHLFGVEDNNPREFPVLCSSYCAEFYSACSTVSINWPSGKNPFGTSTNRIVDSFPSQSDFCSHYQPQTSNSACYSGAKYVLPDAPAPPPQSTNLCLETIVSWSNNEKLVKLVDLNDNSGLYFAAYQNGSVLSMNKQTGATVREVLRVTAWENNEMGLLGLASHPNFASNRRFYVYWTNQNGQATCVDNDWCDGDTCSNGVCQESYAANYIQEYTYQTASGSATLSRTLMQVHKQYMNHNGGDILFGPDGYLYLSLGDGGGSNDFPNNAQNLNRRNGKILRIDVDSSNYAPNRNYAIPSDNPFPSSKFPEIFAYGLRNPWRMSFDRERPSYFFVGDVGEGKIEETNLIVKGGNYGWPWYEGSSPTPNRNNNQPLSSSQRRDPIIQVTHDQSGLSAIGGYMYRGSKDPCQYGKYIFADWPSLGLMYSYESPEGSGSFAFTLNSQRMITRCGNSECNIGGGVHAFSEDSVGDLFIHTSSSTYRVREPSYCGLTCNVQPQTRPSTSTTRVISSTSTLPNQSTTSTNPPKPTGTGPNTLPPSENRASGMIQVQQWENNDCTGDLTKATGYFDGLCIPGVNGRYSKLWVNGNNVLLRQYADPQCCGMELMDGISQDFVINTCKDSFLVLNGSSVVTYESVRDTVVYHYKNNKCDVGYGFEIFYGQAPACTNLTRSCSVNELTSGYSTGGDCSSNFRSMVGSRVTVCSSQPSNPPSKPEDVVISAEPSTQTRAQMEVVGNYTSQKAGEMIAEGLGIGQERVQINGVTQVSYSKKRQTTTVIDFTILDTSGSNSTSYELMQQLIFKVENDPNSLSFSAVGVKVLTVNVDVVPTTSALSTTTPRNQAISKGFALASSHLVVVFLLATFMH